MWWASSTIRTKGRSRVAARNRAVALATAWRRNSGFRAAVSGVSGRSRSRAVPISGSWGRSSGASVSTLGPEVPGHRVLVRVHLEPEQGPAEIPDGGVRGRGLVALADDGHGPNGPGPPGQLLDEPRLAGSLVPDDLDHPPGTADDRVQIGSECLQLLGHPGQREPIDVVVP